MNDPVLDIIRDEKLEPPARVSAIMDMIEARHPDRVLAFVYYGSSLREIDNPEKMLDFYVLVDDYRKTHGSRVRAWLNRHIPPAVFYIEREDGGVLTTCKYSIMTLDEFERRSTKRAFHSQVWGRFSQPCVLLRARDAAIAERVYAARADAVRYMASQSAPLVAPLASSAEIWGRGFYESYRTELRPESSVSRAQEIVERFSDRYDAITTALYGPPNEHGDYTLPVCNPRALERTWFWRRVRGKPRSILRIAHGALTFDGGLDYALRKLKNHSGVDYEPTPFQRKYPLLCAPVMGWKLWRMGAFR
ncbi:hypothetical protein ACJ3XI_06195 [Litorimonas sp. RW-G-Af-16]|uniref:hypothetical protein n=1 Tax=Litorimonas sp. RW-G-Af-16 TaxID=3241168 RepID=UPI00390C4252